ncbi:MAG TPA: (2Fe-2S)-binding protein [Chloroflexota bacterium]|nr:(2Fe-2S)-binding protein [Chloroflexota bacterium]
MGGSSAAALAADHPLGSGGDVKRTITLIVNGVERQLEVQDHWLLSDVLREQLKLYSVREGCGTAVCGSCTVLLDGRPIASCLTLAARLDGRRIETVEGLSQGERLHPIQEAFLEERAFQCGYCTPGYIMAVKGLLDENPDPSEEELLDYLAGNYCRCAGYPDILRAVNSSRLKLARQRAAAGPPTGS